MPRLRLCSRPEARAALCTGRGIDEGRTSTSISRSPLPLRKPLASQAPSDFLAFSAPRSWAERSATKALGLRYSALLTWRRSRSVQVYCDASWGRHPRDFCGHAIIFGGSAISFSSKRIRLVTQSSQEAEIYSYAFAAKDLPFIQQLLQFNGHAIAMPIAISTDTDSDSSSAVPWIRNPGSTARTHHYDNNKDQCADLFTKCEEKSLFLRFRAKLLNCA
eukprot:scaffold33224_cov129-Isochrysis_galbana.AAC.1